MSRSVCDAALAWFVFICAGVDVLLVVYYRFSLVISLLNKIIIITIIMRDYDFLSRENEVIKQSVIIVLH